MSIRTSDLPALARARRAKLREQGYGRQRVATLARRGGMTVLIDVANSPDTGVAVILDLVSPGGVARGSFVIRPAELDALEEAIRVAREMESPSCAR